MSLRYSLPPATRWQKTKVSEPEGAAWSTKALPGETAWPGVPGDAFAATSWLPSCAFGGAVPGELAPASGDAVGSCFLRLIRLASELVRPPTIVFTDATVVVVNEFTDPETAEVAFDFTPCKAPCAVVSVDPEEVNTFGSATAF